MDISRLLSLKSKYLYILIFHSNDHIYAFKENWLGLGIAEPALFISTKAQSLVRNLKSVVNDPCSGDST